MTRLGHAKRNRRGGFTLIELLVVISIIAVLLSLIAPAVQNARRAARRMQCQSNMHNLAVAVQNFASTQNGGLPPLMSQMTSGSSTLTHNWVISLLPVLDESALYRQIRENLSAGVSPAIPANYNIKVLTCPEDINNNNRSHGLSYAANAGFISDELWGQDGGVTHYLFNVNYVSTTPEVWVNSASTCGVQEADGQRAAATGVFWRNFPIPVCSSTVDFSNTDPRVTLDSISAADGVSQTLMFAENVNSTDWGSASVDTCAFGIAVEDEEPATTASMIAPLALGTGAVTIGTDTYHTAQINCQPTTVMGRPRPSSAHLGVVNVVLCDGSTRSLNDGLNELVYARLLTPDGRTFNQGLLSGTDY